jgi:hypothetical protein
VSDAEVEYWRALAEQYRRELEGLRERVLRYLEAPADHIDALMSAARATSDVDCIDGRIDAASEPKPANVKIALDALWNRVAADE